MSEVGNIHDGADLPVVPAGDAGAGVGRRPPAGGRPARVGGEGSTG
jgi:hypothetical protein